MTATQQRTANEISSKFLARSLLDEALKSELFQWRDDHWSGVKVDNRANNSGSGHRQPRSYAFKKKVVDEYKRIREQYPELGGQASGAVADIYMLNRSQVTDWYASRDIIYHRAKNAEQRRLTRWRPKKGRFHLCEEAVMKKFKAERAQGKAVGPFWIRRQMLKEVLIAKPEGWRLFTARNGWLRRFTARQHLSWRRKTNVKRKPVEHRVPFLKRSFAVFRIMLRKHMNKPGYTPQWSIFLPANRWDLDQVPFSLFNVSRTYEQTGAKFVHIAANSTSDDKRFGTLQVLARNVCDPTKPRHGQPRLCIAFRGTGQRISVDEMAQYHPDVFVQWQKECMVRLHTQQ